MKNPFASRKEEKMSKNKDFLTTFMQDELQPYIRKEVDKRVLEILSKEFKFKMSRDEDEDEDEDENEDGRTCRDMSCIAPKCGERSRGPRFSYLCVKHSDTPRKKIEKWQERRRESRA